MICQKSNLIEYNNKLPISGCISVDKKKQTNKKSIVHCLLTSCRSGFPRRNAGSIGALMAP